MGLSRAQGRGVLQSIPLLSISSFVSENQEQLWLGNHLRLGFSESGRGGPAGIELRFAPR